MTIKQALLLLVLVGSVSALSTQPFIVSSPVNFTMLRVWVDNSSGTRYADQYYTMSSTNVYYPYLTNFTLNVSYDGWYNASWMGYNGSWFMGANNTETYIGRGRIDASVIDNLPAGGSSVPFLFNRTGSIQTNSSIGGGNLNVTASLRVNNTLILPANTENKWSTSRSQTQVNARYYPLGTYAEVSAAPSDSWGDEYDITHRIQVGSDDEVINDHPYGYFNEYEGYYAILLGLNITPSIPDSSIKIIKVETHGYVDSNYDTRWLSQIWNFTSSKWVNATITTDNIYNSTYFNTTTDLVSNHRIWILGRTAAELSGDTWAQIDYLGAELIADTAVDGAYWGNNFQVGGSLSVDGAFRPGDVIPATGDSSNLGSGTIYWNGIYTNNANVMTRLNVGASAQNQIAYADMIDAGTCSQCINVVGTGQSNGVGTLLKSQFDAGYGISMGAVHYGIDGKIVVPYRDYETAYSNADNTYIGVRGQSYMNVYDSPVSDYDSAITMVGLQGSAYSWAEDLSNEHPVNMIGVMGLQPSAGTVGFTNYHPMAMYSQGTFGLKVGSPLELDIQGFTTDINGENLKYASNNTYLVATGSGDIVFYVTGTKKLNISKSGIFNSSGYRMG